MGDLINSIPLNATDLEENRLENRADYCKILNSILDWIRFVGGVILKAICSFALRILYKLYSETEDLE